MFDCCSWCQRFKVTSSQCIAPSTDNKSCDCYANNTKGYWMKWIDWCDLAVLAEPVRGFHTRVFVYVRSLFTLLIWVASRRTRFEHSNNKYSTIHTPQMHQTLVSPCIAPPKLSPLIIIHNISRPHTRCVMFSLFFSHTRRSNKRKPNKTNQAWVQDSWAEVHKQHQSRLQY